MGFSKKTIKRNEISGLFEVQDGADKNGEVSVNQLRARMDARQAAINEAHTKDWTDDPNSVNSPAYGDAMSRMPKPSDAVANSKAKHYGVAE
jgi:hypothetical protein